MEKKYYVYGLKDPRNNEYFYIGKGKGNRYKSHLNKNNQKKDGNKSKVERILEIENEGLSVIAEIIFSNLNENIAFELEKVLIYKLGREIIDEGNLTNIAPGGENDYADGVFFSNDFKGNFDISKLDLINKEKFKLFENLTKVDFYDIDFIYVYNNLGSFERKEPLHEFFNRVKPKPIEIERYKQIKKNNLPIFFDAFNSLREGYNMFDSLRSMNNLPEVKHYYILSKVYYEKIYVSFDIPLSRYDIIDEEFHEKFDDLYRKEKKFELICKVDNVVRLIVNRDRNVITVDSYYSSGKIKSTFKVKNRKPIDIERFWYENGNIKFKKEYHKRDKSYIETKYYKNGNKEYYDNPKKHITQHWYKSGKISSMRTHKTGLIMYNEKGEIVHKD